MGRIRSLGRYQKGLLLFMLAMILLFAAVYPTRISNVGFAYRNAILTPRQEGENRVYAGVIGGTEARFTVYPDATVLFQYGSVTYGPYTVREDPTAVPEETDLDVPWRGIELRSGEEICFRGGLWEQDGQRYLCNEDGSWYSTAVATMSDGTQMDENGNVIDPMEPTVSTILDLMEGPALTHRGSWTGWFYGVCICAVTAISILFADELFRLRMYFRVRDAYGVEPSDLEIMFRHISWTALSILAMVAFFVGLA